MGAALYLTGFMGCGKTSTGRILAETLDRAFVDLDESIESESGLTVRTLFDTRGESAFRELETEALERTAEIPNPVVATGGGTVTIERNRKWMQKHGISVWLNLPFQAIAARVEGDEHWDRPLFRDEAQAFDLFQERLPAYREADLMVAIDLDEKADDVAARIILMMGDRVCSS